MKRESQTLPPAGGGEGARRADEGRNLFKAILRILFILLVVSTTLAQTKAPAIPKATNLDFEDGAEGGPPPAWVTPTRGFETKTIAGGAPSGKKYAVLDRTPGATDAHSFGNVMQAIDATPYRGRWVRLRAAVRTKGGSGAARAQLWLRVDRAEGRGGFFDNMNDRPIRSDEWKHYEIIGDVADDATTLNFGVLVFADTSVLIDDVSITDLGKVEVHAEPARPLTDRGLANLVAFTRLFGYVRHFHPSEQAAAANWEKVAIDGVRAVEDAKTSAELIRELDAFFKPLAPTVEIYATGKPPKSRRTTDGQPTISWRHRGFGHPNANTYRSERVTNPATAAPAVALQPYEADLGGGVSARIPLALPTSANGAMPVVGARPPPPPALVKYTGDDRATRIADVVLLWNVIQHFYPYFDVVKTDWMAVLPPALRSAASDAGERELLRTLRVMMVATHDGHGSVYHPSERSNATLPLLFGIVEGKLAVTHVADASLDVKPGDLVERVDGKPAADVLRDLESLVASATPQWRRVGALNRLRFGAEGSELKLDLRSPGAQPRSLTIKRVLLPRLEEPRPPKVHELEPGIFYLDLTRMEGPDWTAALPRVTNAKGVIFDLRGYPRGGVNFLQHLTGKPLESARWNIPIITRPDHIAMTEWDQSGRWELKPEEPRLKGKIVFLTDGRAISYAETVMGIVEAYHLGEIVGEPTAGTNGNVNPITLPGGYRVNWTGMKVLKHDGSRHHGVGIHPTVPVSRTLKGVAEKRDEQLERALALIR